MEEVTEGNVVERGQLKVKNKAGRYKFQYRVEYQDRPDGRVVPAWLTAKRFGFCGTQDRWGTIIWRGMACGQMLPEALEQSRAPVTVEQRFPRKA
ncbi:hypothetical protein V7S43_011770 [Phytophthora oleae]|uniref:Chromo domain-containing protein n=1 Tax=Phytophthora oleae TaxID=2107226 RepID=A0ABD3FEF9_9STRA